MWLRFPAWSATVSKQGVIFWILLNLVQVHEWYKGFSFPSGLAALDIIEIAY